MSERSYRIFMELVQRARQGETGLYATIGGDLVVMSSDRYPALKDQYNELLMCVESVIPGKTRHEAAKEMIRRGEQCAGDCGRTACREGGADGE